MSIRYSATRGLAVATALLVLATGCGGDTPATVATNVAPPAAVVPANETIEGVATPSSVAVVTATNAQ